MKTPLKLTIVAVAIATVTAMASGAEAQETWKKNCALCHGADGSGNTMMGKRLHLKDYTSAEVQAEMTDEEIATTIREGVKNESGKLIMKAFAGTIPDEDIPALVAFVRSLKKG